MTIPICFTLIIVDYFFISWNSLSFMEKLKGNIDTTMYLLSSHLHKVEVFGAQLCPALCNSMDCSPPGSSVHGTLQARILEWVAFCFSRIFPTKTSNPGLPHCKQILYLSESPGKLHVHNLPYYQHAPRKFWCN